MVSYRYIKWSAGIAATVIPIVAVFFMLIQSGDIELLSLDYSNNCAGTPSDICWLEMEFKPNKDIFLGADERWLDTNLPVKSVQLYRSWGKGWRKIPLDTGCTGSWCGCYWCKDGVTAKYSIVFRNDTTYTIRFEAEKHHPRDVIEWEINPVGIWDKAIATKEIKCEKYITIEWDEYIKHTKIEEHCYDLPASYECKDSPYKNGTCDKIQEICYNRTVLDYIETVEMSRQECVESNTEIKYAETLFEPDKENKGCTINTDNIVCDDGVGADGNGDGICNSGEHCYFYKLTDKIELESVYNGDVKIK